MAYCAPIQPGARYNFWKVVAPNGKEWICKCDCGVERSLTTYEVRRLKSCGCRLPRAKVSRDVITPKKKFNRWTVIARAPDAHGHPRWLCRCVCGTLKEVIADLLVKGTSKSCGCKRREMGRQMGISPSYDDLSKGSCDKHEAMQICNNCNADFDPAKEGLVTTHKGKAASCICEGCLTGSRVVKVVLRRGDVGNFGYEQFATLEALAGGLTSPRKAG
jgi:hypothetical protein